MMNDQRKCIWDLDVIVAETHRVVFEEEVTLKEAIEMYSQEIYEDVIDTVNTTIQEVLGGE